MGDIHETEITVIERRESGVFYLRIKEGKDISLEHLTEVAKILNELSGGKEYKVIVDTRDVAVGYIDKKCFRANSLNKISPDKTAEAYLVNELAVKLMVNFYMKVFKPAVPTKMFAGPDEAEKWLRDISKKSSQVNSE